MKAIGALVNWAVFGLVGWLAAKVSAKIAAAIALAAVFISISVAAVSGISAVVAGIEMSASQDLAIAASWFMPDNALYCISALFSASVIRAVLNFQHSIIRLWSTALG